MINVRACDLCHEPLGAQVTRLELVRGVVRFLPRDRWFVAPSAAGIRVRMLCPSCDQYLRDAVQHLTSLVGASAASAGPSVESAASASSGKSGKSGETASAGEEETAQHAVA